MVVIVDYSVGNLGSILNMLRKVGAEAVISGKPEDIVRADKLVLPGVGAFDNGMTRLNDSGLVPLLTQRVLEDQVPILGICLGMQLFTKRSEEGKIPGLGWVDAETRRFSMDLDQSGLKIPHMGWNSVQFVDQDPLRRTFERTPRFYFVHSYHVVCKNPLESVGVTSYGSEFTAVLRKGNILGTQFHPEKSHSFGLRLLTHFAQGS